MYWCRVIDKYLVNSLEDFVPTNRIQYLDSQYNYIICIKSWLRDYLRYV